MDLNDGYSTVTEDDEPRPGGILRPHPGAWSRAAACKGKDPELWFTADRELAQVATAICAACPVQSDCLDHAVRYGEAHGIWGGRSERARARMRRGAA